MTKENAHLFLPLVQAVIDGKTLQGAGRDGTWHDIHSVSLTTAPHLYRIKPEPRAIWINEHDGFWGSAHDSFASANDGSGTAGRTIKFVEVVE